MKTKDTFPSEVLHNTRIFQKETAAKALQEFCKEACQVLRKRTRVTMRNEEDITILTFLTGEVLIDIRISERRCKL